MQDSQRRTLIFSVLDDMKSAGEKVTAQKLATQAKMGKQTVLPYYREWQELEILGEDDGIELSGDLVRVLKREIGKEKFRQGEQARIIQDQLDEERDHYAAQSEIWRQQLDELKSQLESETQAKQHLEEQCEVLQKQNREWEQKLTSISERFEHQSQQLQQLEEKLTQEAKRSEQALAEQERRLDESHTKIIDHWLKVIDEERREKARLLKASEKDSAALATAEKEKVQLESLLANRGRAYDLALEDIEAFKQREEVAKYKVDTLERLQKNLGDDVEARIAELLNAQDELKNRIAENNKLVEQLDSLATAKESNAVLEKENRQLSEQVIRLEARMEGIQLAGALSKKSQ
ncbi:coiled-coil domain-containing protein [Sansalvadorimonas verongulae]|uniref:hypothetical protein n=1 Tax=Sansalvadorimonas verongulae TaxID=2172824 RepID=UPI0012BC85B5|nr:hypothetical protein [Sansalvadorimonas verongulae]MTI13328.1 hypothetical protein [Sansalvadorimonas verongulae]